MPVQPSSTPSIWRIGFSTISGSLGKRCYGRHHCPSKRMQPKRCARAPLEEGRQQECERQLFCGNPIACYVRLSGKRLTRQDVPGLLSQKPIDQVSRLSLNQSPPRYQILAGVDTLMICRSPPSLATMIRSLPAPDRSKKTWRGRDHSVSHQTRRHRYALVARGTHNPAWGK